jgi:hypothetical protein
MGREYYNGRDNYLIYAEETAYATGGTPAISENMGRVQSVSLSMNQNLIRTQGLGDGINAQTVSLGVFDVTGSFSTIPIDFQFLQYGVGYDLTGQTGAEASHYQLNEDGTFGYSSTTNKTIKLELGSKGTSNNEEKTITGVVYNSWTISGEMGTELKCEVAFTGKTVTRGTTIETYTAPSGRPYVFNSGSFKWGATNVLDLTNFSVTCALNPVYPREIGDRFNKLPVLGVRRYDWSLTFNYYKDDTASTIDPTEFLTTFFQDTNTPLTTGSITGSDMFILVSAGAVSGDKQVQIQLENSFINDWAENPTLDGGVVSISVNGFSLAGDTVSGAKVPIEWWSID